MIDGIDVSVFNTYEKGSCYSNNTWLRQGGNEPEKNSTKCWYTMPPINRITSSIYILFFVLIFLFLICSQTTQRSVLSVPSAFFGLCPKFMMMMVIHKTFLFSTCSSETILVHSIITVAVTVTINAKIVARHSNSKTLFWTLRSILSMSVAFEVYLLETIKREFEMKNKKNNNRPAIRRTQSVYTVE